MNKLFLVVLAIAAFAVGVVFTHQAKLKSYRDLDAVPSQGLYDRVQSELINFKVIPPTCDSYAARLSLQEAFKKTAPAWVKKIPNVLNPKPETYDFSEKKFGCVADFALAVSDAEAANYEKYLQSDEYAAAQFPFLKTLEGIAAALTRDEGMAADYLMHDMIKKKEMQLVTEGGKKLLVAKLRYSVVYTDDRVDTDFIAPQIKAYSKLLERIH